MRLAVLTVILLSTLTACGGKPADASAEGAASAAAKATAQAPAATSLETSYEALRLALVADDLDATKRAASDLAKFAGADEIIAKAAHDMGTAADIEVARLAFGDASRAYITLLSKDAELAKGKHAFRCPMAKGYKKWVQLTPELENPYMGQRMLECGGPVEMAP